MQHKELEDLTSDCWMLQIKGIEACVDCQYQLGPDCGGGLTLIQAIDHEKGLSRIAKTIALDYFEADAGSFYDFLKFLKRNKDDGMHEIALEQIKGGYEHLLSRESAQPSTVVDTDEEFPFDYVYNNGNVIERSGWHNLGSQYNRCDCDPLDNLSNASYRDLIIKFKGKRIRYYHQHAIAIRDNDELIVSSCGWHTPTTKERINRELPAGITLYQKDWEWYLKDADGIQVDFVDGIKIRGHSL